MTNDKQRITIAKACGWPIWRLHLIDLDAMRNAAMFLKSKDRFSYAMFHKELEKIVGIGNSIDDAHSWQVADATAAQRAEAFLRALSLWKD